MTLLDCAWSLPVVDPVLSHTEIHIWRAFLDQPLSLVEQLAQTLSAEERARAERYHFAHDRQHFIVARGLLRSILGNYVHVEPDHLQFNSGPHGKPALVQTSSGNVLRFNLSHSHGLALYAFTRDREVGIDLEYIRPIAEAQQIAESYFSVQVRNALRNLPPAELSRQFFIYWTRMEAYLKARGDGLTGLSEELESAKRSGARGSRACEASFNNTTNWSIYDMMPAAGYVAALAVQEENIRIVYYEWGI
jgi:4'-phosphopantetheinyl transferase